MTVISEDHKVTARASLRDWVVLLTLLAGIASSSVIAWKTVESKAEAALAKSERVEGDLSDFKDKIDTKLEKINADTAYIRGMIGHPSQRANGQ